MDTMNKFLIGLNGDDLVFLKPVPQRLSKEDSLLLAAWLVAMVADVDQFMEMLKAIENA